MKSSYLDASIACQLAVAHSGSVQSESSQAARAMNDMKQKSGHGSVDPQLQAANGEV